MNNLLLLTYMKTPVTFILMAVIIFTSLIGIYRTKVFAKFILHLYDISNNSQYYRLITGDLVHNDFVHLGLNLIAFYICGTDLEQRLIQRSANGSIRFLGIYLVSAVVGNVMFTLRNKNKFGESSAGCSGAVLGCLFAFMIAAPFGSDVKVVFLGGIRNIYTGFIYIGVLLYYQWKHKNNMVNHEVHLFGGLGGVIGALLFIPWVSIKIPGL